MPYKNPEDKKANARKYREENKERIYAQIEAIKKNNPEKYRESRRKWKAKNKDRIRRLNALSRERNRESIRAKNKEYQKANPDIVRAKNDRKRAVLAKVEGTYTVQEWKELCERYNFMCLCCNKKEPEIKLTVDHVVPLSKGGRNSIDNLQPLCGPCNFKKHTKIIDFRINFDLKPIQPADSGDNT